jgi:hypothetical protein
MEFTIYTFGDVEIFRAALAGVAMIFNADGFFVSDSGIGLGALTALGLLLGLVVMLLNSIITQKADLGGLVVMVLVFAVLFVPKFSVNVEDYNGDAIAKVDNVPLGVALPAGLVSGLAREMNIRMGTAFSTTEGYPTGLMTPEALRSPLKMLLSLRNGYTLMPERTPVLLSNLTNLVAYCVAGRNFTAPNAQTVKIKDAPITHLLELAETVNGLTMYADPVTKANELRPCKDVASEISSAIDSLYDSSDLTEIMTAAAARTGAAPIRLTAGRPEVQPVTGELMMDNLSMLFQVSGRSAESFIKTSLLMPYVSRAHLCADSNSDPVMWAQCMPFQSGIMQWQEDEAAAGTAFQRIMFHGMNALFFIWICLSPVVAVLMLMMGVRGLKLAGSFLMFGAWTVSWYVGASVVNFYMLKQLQYELAMLGSFDNLTPATIGWFFDTIQNKIAVAGTMMSSVPLIMMTIMSGSMYGMVQLANRWGAKDHYDQMVNSPSMIQGSALHAMQSGGTMKYGAATAFSENMGHGQNFTSSSSAGMAKTFAHESATEASKKLSSGLSHMLDRARTDQNAYQRAVEFGERLEKTGNREVTEAWRNAVSASQGDAREFGDKKATFERSTWGLDAGGGKGGTKAGIGWSQGDQQDSHRSRKESAGTETGTSADFNEKSGLRSSRGLSLGDVEKVSRAAENTFRDSNGASWTSEFAEATKYAEKATEALQVGSTLGGQQTVSDVEMANKLNAFPDAERIVDAAHDRYVNGSDSSPAAAAYREAFNRSERMYSGIVDEEAKQNVRELYALQAAAIAEGGRPGPATATYLEALGAAAGLRVDLKATTSIDTDTTSALREEVKEKTGPANTLVAPSGSTATADKLPTFETMRGKAKAADVSSTGIPGAKEEIVKTNVKKAERVELTGNAMKESNRTQGDITGKGQSGLPAAAKRANEALEDAMAATKKFFNK